MNEDRNAPNDDRNFLANKKIAIGGSKKLINTTTLNAKDRFTAKRFFMIAVNNIGNNLEYEKGIKNF